jgi:hypothetical protein
MYVAQTIVRLMMTKKDTVLQIQKELTEDRGELERTTAGADLASQLDKKLEVRQKEIKFLNEQIDKAEQARDDNSLQRLNSQLTIERQKQIKQMKSRDALRPKIVEETDKSIEEANKEKQTKGERWKTRLQIFAAILSPIIAITASFILPLAGVSLGS